ncbi:MAG: hypothetical protein QM752_05270 [Gammaproteobacteria bacterium]
MNEFMTYREFKDKYQPGRESKERIPLVEDEKSRRPSIFIGKLMRDKAFPYFEEQFDIIPSDIKLKKSAIEAFEVYATQCYQNGNSFSGESAASRAMQEEIELAIQRKNYVTQNRLPCCSAFYAALKGNRKTSVAGNYAEVALLLSGVTLLLSSIAAGAMLATDHLANTQSVAPIQNWVLQKPELAISVLSMALVALLLAFAVSAAIAISERRKIHDAENEATFERELINSNDLK